MLDEAHLRRKRRWLSYGRALLTIGILGLATVGLLAMTQSTDSHDEHFSRTVVENRDQMPHKKEIVENPIFDQLPNRQIIKRSAENKAKKVNRGVPKKIVNNEANSLNEVNYIDSDLRMDHKQSNPKRSEQGSSPNLRHVHSNGDVYYFKGYKCVPMRKPLQSPAEIKRPHDRSGMLCCLLSYFHLLISIHQKNTFGLHLRACGWLRGALRVVRTDLLEICNRIRRPDSVSKYRIENQN